MLTFPGAPPDIGCTWVHYSFSTTFGSRRVRMSVCVSLVADDTTCTCVSFICVSSCRYAYLFSLFQYLPLSLSHPSLSTLALPPSLSFSTCTPILLSLYSRTIYRLSHPLLFFPSFFLFFALSIFPFFSLSPSFSYPPPSIHPSPDISVSVSFHPTRPSSSCSRCKRVRA